jgi:phage tail-like protein
MVNERRQERGWVMAKQAKAAAGRRDPYRNFRFRVEIDGIASAGFSEAVIGETVTEAIDYREGNEPTRVRKLPGLHKFANVTLKRGMTASMDLYNWHKQILDGDIGSARRNVAIVVIDQSGMDAARFHIHDAWPVKYQAGDLIAKGNEVLIETLELANEGIERVQ